VLMVMARYG